MSCLTTLVLLVQTLYWITHSSKLQHGEEHQDLIFGEALHVIPLRIVAVITSGPLTMALSITFKLGSGLRK